MNTYRDKFKALPQGFTLVELMVSMTVLVLMLLSLTQVMNGALKATTGSFKHMDADTQARSVLDRVAFDISKMVKRSDVDYYFKKNLTTGTTPGNDQMAFYSEASGYYPSTSTSTQKSNVSLVGYRINANNQLERLSKGLIWNGVSVSGYNPMVFLPQTITGTWPAILNTGATGDADYQVVGDQVFRFEFCYLIHNSSTAATLTDTPNLEGISAVGTTGYFNPQEVVAIVVTLAVLDARSTATVSSTQLTSAATQLSDISGTPVASIPTTSIPSVITGPAAAAWKTALNSPYALGTALGLPQAASSQVRIYQRYCYLAPVQ